MKTTFFQLTVVFTVCMLFAPACGQGCPYRFEVGSTDQHIELNSSDYLENYVWMADLDGDGSREMLVNCTMGICETEEQYDKPGEFQLRAVDAERRSPPYFYRLEISKVILVPYNVQTSFVLSDWDYEKLYMTCTPILYTPTPKPKCSYSINETSWTATVSCDVDNFYPRKIGDCNFKFTTSNAFTTRERSSTQNVTYTYSGPDPNNGLYKMTCSVQDKVDFLQEGLHRFYASVNDVESDRVEFSLSYPKSITKCQVANANHLGFKDNYVRYGSGLEPTCTCTRTTAGYPPGQVAWFKGEEIVIGPAEEVEVSGVESKELSELYTCRVVSPMGTSDSGKISFIAYGPADVEMAFNYNESMPFDLCPSRTRGIEVTCKTPDDVNPGVRCTVEIQTPSGKSESHEITDTMVQEVSSYVYHYTYHPSEVGEYRITCLVQNKVFVNEISSSTVEAVTTQEVESAPQVIFLNNVQTYEGHILEGEHVDFGCDTCCDTSTTPKTISCDFPLKSLFNEGLNPKVTVSYASKSSYSGGNCTCAVKEPSSCNQTITMRSFTVMTIEDYVKAKEALENRNDDDDDDVNVGAIAGGVVGGVVLILIIAFVVWLVQSRKG